ncbi:hypothetical protein F443_04999 [Phytophthora nicotianae P1569]|uniref:Uncharacterized protein n=1 Tax=Phytophthora nicotianae P1569 TaxID=1317065 RepID=V9FJK2_PHYNI|nr:hypothetical protein F443_04999 [Phytophthora nicotianae P1569]
MIDVEGDAVFGSFPNERFRFGVEHANGIGEIWLESQAPKKRWWGCEVTDVAAFTPADVALPPKDSASLCGGVSLRESASNRANPRPKLVREDEDESLQLEVSIKMGMADLAWAPKYVFPMTLVSQSPLPAEVQAEQITLLTAQVQELSNKK